MDLARYIVEAVELEGRSYREVAQAHGVSKSWVAKLVARYRAGGAEAIKPRSKAANQIPNRTPPQVEDRIVVARKQLAEQGFDAGAQTLQLTDIVDIWGLQDMRGPHDELTAHQEG